MELIGPRHDPMAHAAGDYQTAAPEVERAGFGTTRRRRRDTYLRKWEQVPVFV